MVKGMYLINEAAKEVHVEAHVLRYWEEELKLPIRRNAQGHRLYTQEDIDTFIKIKNLKDKGLQLKAVKTFLEDNPFAQKHFTKLSKTPSEDISAENIENSIIRNTSDSKDTLNNDISNQNTSNKNISQKNNCNKNESVKKNMIEIKSIKSIMKPKNELSEAKPVSEMTPAEQSERLQYLFQKLIREAVSANNEELVNKLVERITGGIRDDVCKELDYQFRMYEERDEERANSRRSEEDKRNEEYYRRIDELLTQYRGKVKTDKTISFPLTNKEKEPKAKKEFHLFKKTPEAKFQ